MRFTQGAQRGKEGWRAMKTSLLKVGLSLGVVLTLINLGWLLFFIRQHLATDAQLDMVSVTVTNFVHIGMSFTLFGIMVGLSMGEAIVCVFEKYERLHSQKDMGGA